MKNIKIDGTCRIYEFDSKEHRFYKENKAMKAKMFMNRLQALSNKGTWKMMSVN